MSSSQEKSNFWFQLTILLILTAGAFAGTYLSAADEFSNYDLIFLLLIVASVVLLEIALLALLRFFHPFNGFKTLVFSAVILFNIYCLKLIFIGEINSLHPILLALCFGAGIFIIVSLISFGCEGRRQALAAIGFIGIILLIDLAPNLFSLIKQEIISSTEDKSTMDAKNVRIVDFKKKPNVYFVSFDSLVPRSIAKLHFGEDGFAYNGVVEKRFHLFRNMFADAVPTRPSLNSVLAMDHEYFFQTIEKNLGNRQNYKLFPGLVPSPLFQIFKANGYQTNSLHDSHYFGLKKGDHVDNYVVNQYFTACQFIDRTINYFAFFGACKLLKSPYGNSLVAGLFGISVDKKLSRFDFLLSKMKDGLKTKIPQIFVAYIYHPGHTPKTYRHTNKEMKAAYRKRHAKRAIETAEMIETLTKFINKEDENAILMIFGDHGPWLSRGLKLAQNPDFFVKDRYAILGGLYPPDVCNDQLKEEGDGFITIMTAIRRIVQCLAGGEDPVTGKTTDRIWGKMIGEKNILYKDYLYE